jgi:hypothetical protein
MVELIYHYLLNWILYRNGLHRSNSSRADNVKTSIHVGGVYFDAVVGCGTNAAVLGIGYDGASDNTKKCYPNNGLKSI